MSKAGKCPHGYTAGGPNEHVFRGGDERKIARHDQRCRTSPTYVAHLAWHGLYYLVCCVACRSRVV